MSETLESWGVKLYPKQKEKVNEILDHLKEEMPSITNRRDSLIYVFENFDKTLEDKIEVITNEEKQLFKLCPIDFLKKVPEIKTQIDKWHCHKPVWKKGKAVLAGNGIDIDSIIIYCESCIKGSEIDEKEKKTHDTVLAIKKFGDSQITVAIHSCIYPENDFLQVLLGDTGTLICTLRNKRVDLNKVCYPNDIDRCEYLTTIDGTINIKESTSYKTLQNELPNLR
jgi:hypothetical protein